MINKVTAIHDKTNSPIQRSVNLHLDIWEKQRRGRLGDTVDKQLSALGEVPLAAEIWEVMLVLRFRTSRDGESKGSWLPVDIDIDIRGW